MTIVKLTGDVFERHDNYSDMKNFLFFTISCTLVGCAGFSDYNDYLEDPPWLGPTRKFSKIGIQRMAKNHQIQGILEKNSLTFP